VFHVEWISLHDMPALIIAFNATMSFCMDGNDRDLEGFSVGAQPLIEGAKWLALCLDDAERGHVEDASYLWAPALAFAASAERH